MNNFGRALRLALRHRLLVIGSIICALIVALTWGGNIGAIYPVAEVAFQGQTLHQWIDNEIATSEKRCEALRLELGAPAANSSAKRAAGSEEGEDHQTIAGRLKAEESALARYRKLQPYIHEYLPNDAFQTLALIVAFVFVGTIIKSIFFIWHSILVSKLSQLAVFDLRKEFYRRTLRMDLATFGDKGTSELMSRFTYDIESLVQGMRALFGKAVREPLKMLACLIGAAFICWRLLLLTLILAPLAAYLVRRLAGSLKRANRRAMENMSQVYNILDETFQGIKVVKAFTMERYERRRFHANSKSFYTRAMRIARYDALTRPLTEILGMGTICLGLMAGAYLVLKGQTHLFGIPMSDRPLTRNSLLLFYGLLAGISDPARKLSEVFNYLQKAAAASDRIYAMLDREPTIRDPEQPVRLGRHTKELVIDNVSFSYVPGVPVVEQTSLKVAFGETIAIVGPNGCGKSTLVNLIPRFYDPTEGRVCLDGVDLRQVRLKDLRRQIGLVTQETLLFDDTVFNNIRYGSASATREQVIEAAKQAHAHRFIEERLEKGYDTIVGPRGSALSGGQRQRIALARAILRNPAILILDEATSQIDLESEQLIHRVLEQFIRNRTTFIITHRMSTLALADRIVVMDMGRILDVGTHDELLRRNPVYARLHALQFRETA